MSPHRPLGRTHFLLGIFFLPTQQSLLLCQAGSPATTAVSCASVHWLSSCRITAWFHCLNPPQGLDLCSYFKAACGDRSICLSGLFLLSTAAWGFPLPFTSCLRKCLWIEPDILLLPKGLALVPTRLLGTPAVSATRASLLSATEAIQVRLRVCPESQVCPTRIHPGERGPLGPGRFAVWSQCLLNELCRW